MAKLIKKLLLSASVAAGVSTVGAVPAIAADFTTTGVTTENYWGQELTTADVIIYETETKGEQTYTKENTSWDNNDDIISLLNGSDEKPGILDGDSSNPGGNIELFASSEVGGDFWASTTLTGNINGQELKLSSLNADDWWTLQENGQALAVNWFIGFWNSNNTWFNESFDNIVSLFEESDNPLLNATAYYLDINEYNRMSTAYQVFGMVGGFERASDPNISYINSDGNDIKIGLAGHDDLASFYSDNFEEGMSWYLSELGIEVDLGEHELLSSSKLQASEVVKYTYNGVTDYLYSFEATESGLVEQGDGASHSGNYEVTIAGAGVASVPEPSTMIGLMTVGGLLAAAKKKGQSKKEA